MEDNYTEEGGSRNMRWTIVNPGGYQVLQTLTQHPAHCHHLWCVAHSAFILFNADCICNLLESVTALEEAAHASHPSHLQHHRRFFLWYCVPIAKIIHSDVPTHALRILHRPQVSLRQVATILPSAKYIIPVPRLFRVCTIIHLHWLRELVRLFSPAALGAGWKVPQRHQLVQDRLDR